MLYILSLHFPDDPIMVMANKYMYEVFFEEPDFRTCKKADISGPHWSSTRFIAEYLMSTFPSGTAESEKVEKIIKSVFPDLFPYLQGQRCCRGLDLKAKTIKVDYKAFGDTMEFFLSLDWVALHHTAELEERREAVALRYVIIKSTSSM